MRDPSEEGAEPTASAPSDSLGRTLRGLLRWTSRVARHATRLIVRLYRRPMPALGATLVIAFFALALVGPWVAPFSATEQNFQATLESPSAQHPFGTDRFGRDIFSRVIVGTQSIFELAGIGTLLGVLIGTGLGLLSGFRGGWFDEILMRIFDSILAIPALLLALLLLGTIGPAATDDLWIFHALTVLSLGMIEPSEVSVLLVIAIVYTPIVARVVRSDVLAIKTRDYVETARLQGESTAYILTREILPSILPALSVEAALRFSYAIFLVASLGFLGVGVQPPTPNWGLMVRAARDFTDIAPWWLIFPAGAISLLVVGMNLLADGLKRVLQSSEELAASGARASVPVHDADEGSNPNEDRESTPSETAVLAARDVTVAYESQGRALDAVRNVSLAIEPGETLGLVGESGSGKSTLALAMMRYLPANGWVRHGQIAFDGRELLDLDESGLRDLWGKEISLVPQNPSASLNPSLQIGEQIAEVLQRHTDLNGPDRERRIRELLDQVRIGDPERVANSYPHELSGGMQQRAMIAMALSTSPKLLVMDEPTTGLDVTTEATVLDLVDDLIAQRETSMLYITHDLGVVARIADRVAVLYAGELVETARTTELYERPLHPYTRGLLDSVPRLGERKEIVRLSSMRGRIPAPTERPGGCVFAPRCPVAVDRCHAERPTLDVAARGDVANARHVRCHRWAEIDRGEIHAGRRSKAASPSREAADSDGHAPVLGIAQLHVHFPVKRSLTEVVRGRPRDVVKAVDGVGLNVHEGETLGLVGESGSGKTTLARSILGLVPPSEGRLELQAHELPTTLDGRDLDVLRHLQLVSQNPEEALNPYQTIGQILQRPLRRLQGKPKAEAARDVDRLLDWVRLGPEYASRLPAQLSGGEKQRVAIARAFAARPDLVVCDEPTSALDVSVQARILNLLADLQSEGGGAYLFISHDLAVVGYLADAIAVIYLGQIMDLGRRETFFEPPFHPYTEALLSSVPLLDPTQTTSRVHLNGDIPSPTDVPSGCPFHTRCPRYLGNICEAEAPPIRETSDGRRIACHIPLEELEREQEPMGMPSEPQAPEPTEEARD